MRQNVAKVAMIVCCCVCAVCRPASGGASWSGQPYTLAIPDHITGLAQARSGSLVMTLDHDLPCTITISVAEAGDEVLASAGDTLVTSYMLTGAALGNGDTEWVDSSTFLTRNYSVQGTGPSDGIKIWVRSTASSARANDAGEYSASVILTASW